MADHATIKKAAIRYWERKRMLYNGVLILPALLGYGLSAGVAAGVGDQRHLGGIAVACLFLTSAIAANVCFSFGYALEFWFGTDDPQSRWPRFWRPLAVAVGFSLSIPLALVGGRNIGWLEYAYR